MPSGAASAADARAFTALYSRSLSALARAVATPMKIRVGSARRAAEAAAAVEGVRAAVAESAAAGGGDGTAGAWAAIHKARKGISGSNESSGNNAFVRFRDVTVRCAGSSTSFLVDLTAAVVAAAPNATDAQNVQEFCAAVADVVAAMPFAAGAEAGRGGEEEEGGKRGEKRRSGIELPPASAARWVVYLTLWYTMFHFLPPHATHTHTFSPFANHLSPSSPVVRSPQTVAPLHSPPHAPRSSPSPHLPSRGRRRTRRRRRPCAPLDRAWMELS